MDFFCRVLVFINSKRLLPIKQLVKLRHLNPKIKNLIDEQTLYHLMSAYRKIKEILTFDTKLYDKYFYQRTIIQNRLKTDLEKYLNLKRISFTGNLPMPGEYYMLIKYYSCFPSHKIKLMPVEFMESHGLWSKKTIDKLESNDALFVVPICYTEHYQKTKMDQQFISFFCYSSAVSENLKEIFEKHFYSIDVPFIDIDKALSFLDKFLKELTTKVNSHKTDDIEFIPTNIANLNKQFDEAFSEFAKKYHPLF